MYTTEFVDVPLGDLLTRVQTLKHEGLRFVQLAAENPASGMELVYTFYDVTCDKALNLCVKLPEDAEVPSIQGLYLAAFSYENETHDLFGVKFINMQIDFGGHFFNVAEDAPMTIITPEQKAAREKAAKAKAAAAAKEAKAAREAAEAASAERAMTQSAAEADAAAVAAVNAVAPSAAEAPARPKVSAEQRAKQMEEKLAAMDPEKAAKVRAALAARAAKDGAAAGGSPAGSAPAASEPAVKEGE